MAQHYNLNFDTIHHPDVFFNVSVFAWQGLIKTVHRVSSADTCLSQEGRAWHG